MSKKIGNGTKKNGKTPMTAATTPKEWRDGLRLAALLLFKNGMDPDTIADKLGIAKSTLSAWRAHATRGTYVTK